MRTTSLLIVSVLGAFPCAAPASAQDVSQSLIPTDPLVIYNQPPTGLFTGSVPLAVVTGEGSGGTVYALRPADKAGTFQLGAADRLTADGLAITATQNVAQAGGVNTWVQIQLDAAMTTPPASPDATTAAALPPRGWVLCDKVFTDTESMATQACSNFMLK